MTDACAPDTSPAVCARLLHAPAHLPALGELQTFLEGSTVVPLPLPDRWYTRLEVTPECAHVLSCLQRASVDGAESLAEVTGTALSWLWSPGNSEQHTLLAAEALFIHPLAQLDRLAPPGTQLSLKKQRDSSDTSTGMTAPSTSGKPLRPDLQLRSSDGLRLLFKGEDKADCLAEAVADLTRKMPPRWSPLLYGNLPYLLCYAAAGSQFQLFAISSSDTRTAVPVSRVYDMARLDSRVSMLRLAVQTHRVLQLMNALLPTHMLPVDVDAVATTRLPNGASFTRIITFEGATLTARKRVSGWTVYATAFATDLRTLKAVYTATAHARGLVHAVRGPAVDKDTYAVVLAPLGLRGVDAEPRDEAALCAAAHGVLHGLAALHAAGFVHCDLRWANVACEAGAQEQPRAYFLLDLEACRCAGAPVTPDTVLSTWPHGALDAPPPGQAGQAGEAHPRYTFASDMHCFGRMLLACAAGRGALSGPARAFMARFQAEGHEALPTAARALQDPWLRCAGPSCCAAGAAPVTSVAGGPRD